MEIQMLEICKYMGWDYITYIQQPDWFIDLIKIRKSEEASAAEAKERKAQANLRRSKI